MNKETIKKIVDAAILAPSGDNVQPWDFKVSKDFSRLDLYNLPERDDSYFNYLQAASYIGHGAVIENIMISARHLGCKVDIELFPDLKNPDHIASFNFQAVPTERDPLYESIFSRSTNRFRYQSSQLSNTDRQKLIDAVEHVEGVAGYFAFDSKTIKELAKALMVNDHLVFERQDIHRFLFDKIRWNQKQINETKDGMPIDTLGLSGFEKLFFPLLRFWRFVGFANHFGLSRVIGMKSWYNFRNVALIGQITVKKADRHAFIQAGRAMQRVWLEATRQGLAFQPLVGLPLLIYRAKENALSEFSERHRQLIDQAESALRALFVIDRQEQLIVGFRIGKGMEQRVIHKTLRKPVHNCEG